MGKLIDLTKRLCRNSYLTPIPAIQKGLGIDQQKDFFRVSKGSARGLWDYLRRLHQGRSLTAPDAPDMSDFAQVLAHWGITEEELSKVIRGFKVQAWSMAIPLGLGVLAVMQGMACTALILFLVAVVGIFTSAWRAQVLTYRDFIPFSRWITFRWGRWGQAGEEE